MAARRFVQFISILQTELQGPGKLLVYRAMNQKLRTKHNVKVPRHLVHNMMRKLDPEGIEGRNLQKKAKPVKKPFTSEGHYGSYPLTDMTNCVAIKTQLFRLVYMTAWTLSHAKYSLYLFAILIPVL
jgi:hypothetical protein